MHLIETQNLALGYEGHTVVSQVTLHVEENDYLCLVGSNGGGKSTLIRSFASLLSPMEGEICFADSLKRGEIGYMPQVRQIQSDFPASVWEVVRSGCLLSGPFRPFYTKEQNRKALEVMEEMDILPLKKESFRALSGGQQQRVLLCRALCCAKKLLLLDEPVAGLDPNSTQTMYACIDRCHEKGMSIVMVSHDIASVLPRAKHILHMERQPLFFGETQAYLQSSAAQLFHLSTASETQKGTVC